MRKYLILLAIVLVSLAANATMQYDGFLRDPAGGGTGNGLPAPFTWNINAATCTGDGNGGALTVNVSNEVVCSADDGGAGGSGDITSVGNCLNGACAVEGGTDIFPFIYEGTPNTFETTFTVTDPTADRTVNFIDASGDVVIDTATQTLTNKTLNSANNVIHADDAIQLVTNPTDCVGLSNFAQSIDASGNLGCNAVNVFSTWDAPAGTDPVADSVTDIMQLFVNPGFGITGDATNDNLTFGFDYSTTLAGNPVLGAGQCVFSTDGTGGGFLCEGATADTVEGLLQWSPTTSDRTLTLPDATDTLVGKATTDTLTNKTLAAANNVIDADTAIVLAADPTDCSANQFATAIAASGNLTCAQPSFSNISGTVAAAQLPNPTSTTLGGIRSYAAVANQWINAISTSGIPSSTQPAFSDISGTVTDAQVPDNITASLYLLLTGGTLTGVVNQDNATAFRFSELDSNGANYQALKAADSLTSDNTFSLNINPATCTGDGNGGALTINGSNEIVCSADDGGAGGGSGDITDVGSCATGACAIEGGNDMFPFIYEGTADANETTFAATNPTADRTITFPNATGTVLLSQGQTLVQLRPQANEPPATSFATMNTRNSHPALRFNGNVCAIWSFVLPNGYSGNGATVEFWVVSTETTNNTAWNVSWERIATSLDIDADGFATAVASTGNNNSATSGIATKVSVAFTNGTQMNSCAAGELCRLKICRDDTTDTGGADTIDYIGGQIRETP